MTVSSGDGGDGDGVHPRHPRVLLSGGGDGDVTVMVTVMMVTVMSVTVMVVTVVMRPLNRLRA